MGDLRSSGASCPSFCVVVPMLNEESNAERCVRAIVSTLTVFSCRTALVVVNDGSTDGTGVVLERLTHECSALTVVTHDRNGGYGRAIQTGMQEADARGFEYVVFMDSDLTNDPRHIVEFARRMEQGCDVIKASRYVPGGGMVGVPIHRVIASVAGNLVTKWLMGLPITDCTNGFRAIRIAALRGASLKEPGFAIILEELYYLKFLARTFCEFPYVLTSRQADPSPSKFSYRPKVFWRYLKYPVKARFGIRPKLD